jgi:hypothetical protein
MADVPTMHSISRGRQTMKSTVMRIRTPTVPTLLTARAMITASVPFTLDLTAPANLGAPLTTLRKIVHRTGAGAFSPSIVNMAGEIHNGVDFRGPGVQERPVGGG